MPHEIKSGSVPSAISSGSSRIDSGSTNGNPGYYQDAIGLPAGMPAWASLSVDLREAINRLDRGGHVYDKEPCDTCRVMSKALDRTFGCCRLRYGETFDVRSI